MPKKVDKPLSLEEKVKGHYQRGEGSIQDIARVYDISVDQVLVWIGEEALAHVDFVGDQIDPAQAEGNFNSGKRVKVPFSTN